jgi:predicted nucleotidyltransferase
MPIAMISPEDRRLLELFARRVRLLAPTSSIWAFGSRTRGSAHPESDLDLCVVVPQTTRDLREAIHAIAWEIGFEQDRVLAPIILSKEDFERGPMSASTLVANIRRDGIAA